MQFILDNLVAVLVATVLFLGLQITQVRSQHAGLEQVAAHSVKTKTLIFGRWAEEDVLSIGANFGANMYRFDDPVTDADGNMTEWTFFSDTSRVESGSTIKTRVFRRWRMVPNGTASFVDGTFPVYTVERDSAVVDYTGTVAPTLAGLTASDWKASYKSIGTVSFFRVDLLDRYGETPTDPATGKADVLKVDYIRIRFGVVPEHNLRLNTDIAKSYHVRELYWSKTLKIRPYWVPPPTSS